ncbi:UNVERIFIED_CONTAM: hypothetical protein Slati_1922400 [Sesamum latifolium]|uniref:DUF659 domain-containing protein n=1 Tax=Sesamum latifolium TaxID=2727402 RepID=A0AAW2X6N6_9LAMI
MATSSGTTAAATAMALEQQRHHRRRSSSNRDTSLLLQNKNVFYGTNTDTSSSTPISAPSQRGKTDVTWNHIVERLIDIKKVICSMYCGKVSTGGGINRMKQHLAGKKGEIRVCPKVPPDVRYQMEQALKEIVEKKKENRENYVTNNPYGSLAIERDHIVEYDDIEEIERQESREKNAQPSVGKEKTRIGQRQSSKIGKDAGKKAHLEVAKFFYDTCIPINACNSRYFQRMFDAALAIGPGYKVPTYHEFRLPLLKDAKKEVQLWVDNIRSNWAHYGCTIMGDGWTDNKNRTLINFLIYCPRGTIFWKSVDPSDIVKDAQALFNLFQEVIEWVGPTNVVHMVIDNGANYVAAGRKALVTCKEFVDSRFARERKTKEVIAIVLDNKFWNDCLIIVKIMEPLMRLLKIVDGDKKPSIGYMYEGLYQARKGIKNLFKNKKRLYKPYTTIIKSRWDRQLRKDIHAVAYWFNPAFQYEQASFCQKSEVMNDVLEVITTKGIGSKSKLFHETRLFRDRLESFGQELALETSKNT